MQKIRIDFDNPGLPQHISAVENDSQSRFFQATLYENGKAYTAPEGAAYSIMYRGFGPQNQGWYDTINDGAGKRAACAVSGNVVTCEIARQALQVPGHVSIVLCVTTGNGYMLKSWPIECDCKNDRYDSTVEIQSFFYVTQVSNADWNRILQALEDLKNTIDPTLSLSGKAADAAKVGEAINAESERAKGVESQIKEDLGSISPIVLNQLTYNFANSIPAVVEYLMIKGHEYLFTNESDNNASISALETKDGEVSAAISGNMPGKTSLTFTSDKTYKYLKIYVNGGGTLSVIDKNSLSETVSTLDENIKNNSVEINENRNNITYSNSINKKLYSAGNSKVNFDKYNGLTFAEFRDNNRSPIFIIEDSVLSDSTEYSWNLQCSKNSAIEYGTNIMLSVGVKKSGNENIEWLVENVIANSPFSSENMSKANVFKFVTTRTWTNVADPQTITYINVFAVADGNTYNTYKKTIKNDLTNWWEGKSGDSLGDSLTGQGFFQKWTRRYLGLSYFYNHGIGGTKMSGLANQNGDSMWMDSRINSLNFDVDFVTILGGQNDGSVGIGDLTIENHDTNTFAGAFNVIISKLYYKYLALNSGYYTDIDYSGINKSENPHNIVIVPCTPFFVPNTTQNLDEKANAIRVLSCLWSLNVADFREKSQSNIALKEVYWGTDTTHPLELFYKERIAPILISTLKELPPIDWDRTIYGS